MPSSSVIDKMPPSSIIDKMMSSLVIDTMTSSVSNRQKITSSDVIRHCLTFTLSVVNKMSNRKFPYSFFVQYEKICCLKICVYNKEMSWFWNTNTNLYNAGSAAVAATRDALSERLQSAHDTASLLYYRTMHYIGETLKNIVENAAK